MASGYIGKISAVVTANTSDLSRKLTEGRDKVKIFANSLNASISSASRQATASLESIFTPLQRLERKLQTALRLNLRTEDQVNKIRQLVSVSEQINKPLAQASKSFGRLSADVQSAFFPALRRAQNETVKISNELARTGKVSAESFARAERAVNNVIAAQRRLLQVQELVRSGFSGRELQFASPRTFAALQAAALASQRAAALPAGQLESGDIARRVQSLQRLRDQIAKQFARVSEIQLRPNVDASRLAGAERRLAQLVARTESASRQLDAIAAKGTRTKGLNLALTGRPQDLQQAEAIYGRLVAQVQSLDAVQRRAFAPNLRSLGRLIDAGDENRLRDVRALIVSLQRELGKQGKVSIEVGDARKRLSELRAEIQGLDAAQRRAFGANLRRLSSLVRTDDASKLADIRRVIREIERDLAKQLRINLRTEEAKQKVDEIKARLRGISDSLVGRQSDPFDRLAASAEKARAAVDRLADSRRKTALQGRIAAVEGTIATAAAPGSGITAGQLAALARSRSAQLDRITASAGARTATDIFGPALRSAQQRVEALRSQIQSAQSGIAALPGPIQSRLIPLLNRARDAFASLGQTPTAAEIRRAAGAAADLEKQLKRAQAAAQFRGTFRGFLNDNAVERYRSQLEFVQRQLASVGATASGPVAAAINRFQRALADAANAGTLGTQRTRREMEQYVQAIARAAVQTRLLTQAQAQAFARSVATAGNRTGDIGRFGVDKLTLGLGQLAFAIDDLFSATGGFDQRLRAVSNNITQLGFIVGGVTGLWVGLFAVVGGQGLLAFQRFINKGVESQDRLKLLGQAAKQQEQIIKDLAEAFDALSEDLAQRGLTEATRRAEQLSKRLDDIIKKQQQLQQQRLADVDPDVQAARGQQAVFQRRLDAAETPGARIALQSLLDEQRRREEAAVASVLGNARGVDVGASIRQITDLIFREQLEAIGDAGGVQAQRGVPFFQILPESAQFQRDVARDRAAFAFGGIDPANREAVRAAAIEQRDRLTTPAAKRTVFGFRTNEAAAAEEALVAVERLIRSIDAIGRQADLDRFAQGVARAANSVDEFLPKAIGRLQETAEIIREPSLALIAEIESLTGSLRQQADAVQAANTKGDVSAARAAETRASEIAAQIKAREIEIAAIESTADSVKQFADTLDRISTQLANTVAQEARSVADQARRDANAAQARADRLGNPLADADSDFARRQRQRLERDARRAEDQAAEVKAENSRVRDEFDRDARRGGLGEELQRLIRERDSIDAVLRGDIAASDEQRQQARRRRDEIDRQLDRQFEDSPEGRAARGRGDAADRERAVAAQRGDEIARGRELARSPAEQAGRQLADDLRALQAARDEAIAGGGNRAELQREFAADRQRIIEESFRSTAPAIFALADSVANAIAQGPSRAALQATDVSTIEGARELNRLLRGDDAARDQNLVELQKQSQSLDELVRIAREGGAVIAD